MSDFADDLQTPLHDGGVVPNLTGYKEKDFSGESFPIETLAYGMPSPPDPSLGVAVDITSLKAG